MAPWGFIIALIGFFLFPLALLVPILLAFNVKGVRDRIYASRLSRIPGFRSGTRWKTLLGSFGYLFLISSVVFGTGAVMMASHTIEVTETNLSQGEIYAGEDVQVSAVIENTGNESTSGIVVLYSNGENTKQTRVSLKPGETRTVKFTHTFNEPGSYEIKIEDVTVGTLQVKANIEVGQTQVSESEIRAGDSVEVQAKIQNSGNKSETRTVALAVDGEVVAEKDVSLAPGETQSVTFSHSFEETGEYTVSIDGQEVGSVNVEAKTTTETTTTTKQSTTTTSTTTTRTSTPTTTTVSPSNDDYYTDLMRQTLESEGYDVREIRVANGRDNGGDKTVIVSVRSSATSTEELSSEIGAYTGVFVGAVEAGWDIDAMIVVVGNQNGEAVGTFYVKEEWVQRYLEGEITAEELSAKVLETLEAM